jgi:hypothetical protein
MNNEPVAIRYDFDGYGYQYMDSGSGSDWLTRVNGDLLYTHPAKTLTDEEILSLTGFKDNPYDIFIEYEKEDLIEFARAILRKAQEK